MSTFKRCIIIIIIMTGSLTEGSVIRSLMKPAVCSATDQQVGE